MNRTAISLPIRQVFVSLALAAGFLVGGAPGALGSIPGASVRLPLAFEANEGQSESGVRFLAHGSGCTVFLKSGEVVLQLHRRKSSTGVLSHSRPGISGLPPVDRAPEEAVVRMRLRGANPTARVEGLDRLSGTSSYFIGSDPSRWHTDVPTYAKVRCKAVYPGVDLVYYGRLRQLEYDFVVSPDADPRNIRLELSSAEGGRWRDDRTLVKSGKGRSHDAAGSGLMSAASAPLRLTGNGDLAVGMGDRGVVWSRPIAYQETGRGRQPIAAHYRLDGRGGVRFALGAYDPRRPLVIDPALRYSTYLAGSGYDDANGIAVDAAGDAYVVGSTDSVNFPVTSGFPSTTITGNARVAYIAKLNPTGSALIYCDYIGSSLGTAGNGIAVDASGNAYITGNTYSASGSSDFPVTTGAFEKSFGGGNYDSFLTEVNASGSQLLYSSFLGGSGNDSGTSLAVAGTSATLVGYTSSSNFPTTGAPYQSKPGGGVDIFVSRIDTSKAGAGSLVYSSFLGGSGNDRAFGVALDAAGNVYVTGSTSSSNFPTTTGALQPGYGNAPEGFVTKIQPGQGAASLLYSTYLGGSSGSDSGSGIAVTPGGEAYVTGTTSSTDFPTTAGALQRVLDAGVGTSSDAFLSRFDLAPNSSQGLVYSTYLGGGGDDAGNAVAVDASGRAYVTGSTASTNFPTTGGAFQKTIAGYLNAFIVRLDTDRAGGASLLYGTYLGSPGYDSASAIAVDAGGNALIAGATSSKNFPTTVGAFQRSSGGDGVSDAFVARAPTATLFDIDGDGQADLLWQNRSTGGVYYWLMNGGTYTGLGGYVIPSIDTSWRVAQVADLNGDGNPDLIWQNSSTGGVYYWIMNGGQYTGNGNYIIPSIDTSWQVVGAADFNGDGQADLLWQNRSTGGVYYWLMNGGTYTGQGGYIIESLDPAWKIVGTPDLNGDGQPDLLWQNSNTGGVYYWIMNGGQYTGMGGYIIPSIDLSWHVVGTPDLNGDGQPDLLWQNSTTGGVYYWIMNGAQYSGNGAYVIGSIDLNWQVVGLH